MAKRRCHIAVVALVSLVTVVKASEDESSSDEMLLHDETSPSEETPHEMSTAASHADTSTSPSGATGAGAEMVSPADWTIQGNPRQSEFRGNWLKKRRISKQARALYEKLHELVVGDWEKQHKEFAESMGRIIATMKQRRQELGVDDADIAYVQEHSAEIVTHMLQLDKAKHADRKEGASPRYDQAAYVEQLEELRAIMKELDEPQNAAGQVAETVSRQTPLGLSYEQEVWQNYEAIDDAYDDRRAEELFLTMESKYEHLTELILYLQRELTPYTQRLVTLFDERIMKAQSMRDALMKEGIPLRPSELRALKDAAHKALQVKSVGWFERTMEVVSYPFVRTWKWLKSWF